MKLLIFDNYDSFTYNIAHAMRELGVCADVIRNDKITLGEIEKYDKIIISPGPGIPSEAGILPQLLRQYSSQKPILGICLGHQAIGECFGAKLTNLTEVYHGVQSEINILVDDYIFEGVTAKPEVGRYHSWVVSKEDFPICLEITSESPDGQIMSLRHKDFDVRGIQFHPESILTPEGKKMLSNWLNH